MWEIEQSYFDQGYQLICGADEAGAGPLAGPVYAAAVILPPGLMLPWLNDSKKVTAKRRDILFDQIKEQAVAWSIACVDADEIDCLDILNARMKAMQMAIDALPLQPDFSLIDGDRDHGSRCAIITPHQTIIEGDARSASIAAASILAKVSRDRHMEELDAIYPGYGFAGHKGYPTKAHYLALDELGPSPVHRQTFLKKWREKRGDGRK